MRFGRRPGVRVPFISPRRKPTNSNTVSRALARLRSRRMADVSRPWVVRAWAQRCRPSSVFGPVDLPPCWAHLARPSITWAPHALPEREITALHVGFDASLDMALRLDAGSFARNTIIFQGLSPADWLLIELAPSMRGRVTRPARDVDLSAPRKLLISFGKVWDFVFLNQPRD
jgi:hypothetical protein